MADQDKYGQNTAHQKASDHQAITHLRLRLSYLEHALQDREGIISALEKILAERRARVAEYQEMGKAVCEILDNGLETIELTQGTAWEKWSAREVEQILLRIGHAIGHLRSAGKAVLSLPVMSPRFGEWVTEGRIGLAGISFTNSGHSITATCLAFQFSS